MKPEVAKKILEQTTIGYNTIASSFDQTRRYLWPGLEDFKKYIKPGDKILDLGCGNGKLRLLFKDVKINYNGVDPSRKLIDLAKSKPEFDLEKQQFVVAGADKLPFPDDTFDLVFFIATFHHIPSDKLRLEALKEVKRVLKPSGRLIMANWNQWRKKHFHYIIKYAWLKITGRSDLDFKDIFIPWMDGKVKRYFRAFTKGELRGLVRMAGLKFENGYLSSWDSDKKGRFNYLKASNIVTIAKKC